MAGTIQDSPEGKCWTGIQSINCEQPQHTWETGSAPASMATNHNWWERYKGKPLTPWSITCKWITDLREHYHVLSRTRSTYISYFFPTYFYLCLSQFPLLHKICLLPITLPNRSLCYSRNCQGKQTTKLASLSIVGPQRWFSWMFGLTMFLWWICWYSLLRDEGCWWQTWGGCKGKEKTLLSQFSCVLKS